MLGTPVDNTGAAEKVQRDLHGGQAGPIAQLVYDVFSYYHRASRQGLRNSSGSSAIFAAIRRASSLVSSFCGRAPPRLVLEINIRELLSGVVLHDETVLQFIDPAHRSPGSTQSVYAETSKVDNSLFE